MAKTTIPSKCTLKWTLANNNTGSWTCGGSSLQNWDVQPNATTTFTLESSMSTDTYALIENQGGDTYAVRKFTSTKPTSIEITPKGTLSLTAGTLVSADPKLKIASGSKNCYFKWDKDTNNAWQWWHCDDGKRWAKLGTTDTVEVDSTALITITDMAATGGTHHILVGVLPNNSGPNGTSDDGTVKMKLSFNNTKAQTVDLAKLGPSDETWYFHLFTVLNSTGVTQLQAHGKSG